MEARHKLRVDLQLTDAQLRELAGASYGHGFTRVEPRKAWSTQEYKEAARATVTGLVCRLLIDAGRGPAREVDGA